MNENLKDTKLKKKSSGVITKKKSTQADTKLLISNKKNDQVTSSSLITNESPIIKQIKKSVSRLDTTSDIGLENLVNVLHHFAFGDNNQKQSLNAKKSMIKQETESVDDDDDDDDDFENCGVVVEELCSCERREINLNKYCQQHDHQDPSIKTNRNNNGSSSLLHLSLSIGKKSEADDLKFKQNLLSSKLEERYLDYFEEVHNEDEQIKRKENLLQELLKIEKQLDSQKNLNNLNEIASSISPSITIKNSPSAQPSQPVDTKTNNSNNNNNNNSNNYDHISMINKYLIKKCQYDLNRLYKIKLKQLQQKPIEIKPPTNFQIGGSNTAITATTTTTTTTQSSMKNIKTAKKRLISSSSSSSSTSSPSVIKQQQQKETSNNSSTVISASISNSLIEFKKLSNNPDILNKGPVESSITTLNDLQTNYFKSTNKDKSEQQHTCSHGTHHHHYHHHNHHHNHQVANKSNNNNNNNVLQITNNKNKIKSNTKQRLDQQQQPSSPLSSSSSTCSDDWLPPPPPPFAAAAAYLIQQSMKNKASQNNYPHIDLDAATESNHDTALTVACAGGHEELVKLLIEKGAHIEHRDKKGFTPLILAATLGYQRIVQLLLIYGADVEAQSERNKDTALSAACQAGKYECCEILLTKGQANKEHRNISDYTPLSLAASGGYVNIIKLLLSHGAEINSRTGSKLGISPLMLAAMNGHTQAVKLLIDMGSDVNAQIETNRNTALTLACFQGRHDVVSLLLERKANIEHRAKTGLTPLMEAASGGYEIVGRILLEKGADVNASPVPNSKDTALTIAAEKGHLKFVQLLIEYGSQLDVKNKKGATPLWLACQNGHLEVAQTLVLNSSDPDSTDSRKVSCLMSAFRKGHVKVCKFMVRHVRQFPSDQDCKRLIDSLNETSSASNSFNNTKITAVLSNKNQPTHISLSNLGSIQQNNQQNNNNNMIDKDLIKRCMQCMELIFQAKDKQAQEANRVANNLLKEIECEKTKEQNKKAAAQRKREKRKQKKKQQTKEEKQQDADDLKEAKKGAETKKSDNKKLEANKKIKEIDDDVSDNNSEPNQSSSESDQEEEPQIKKEDPKFSNKATNIKLNSVPIKSNEIKEKLAKDKTNIPSKNLQQQSKILPLANSNKQQQLTLNKKMSQTNLSSLADLDDFDQPSPSSTLTVIKKANNKTANNSKTQNNISTQAQNNSNYNSNKQKQRIIVPFDKFLRVMGHANSNLKIIQEVTGTSLEVEDKKIPPNQDRSILIRGESVDMVKYAFELLQALINDADVELLNLLPSKPEPTTSNKSALNSQQQQNKWATPLVTSNTSKSTSNYNPLLGGITLLNDKTVDLSKKPRNFAEVVAKQSISTTTLNSDTVATNRISNIEKKNNSDANKQTQQQLNTNTRKHNSVSPFQKPAAIAATSQTYASKNNQVNSNVSSTQNLNKLNNLVVPLNENKNNNKVPIVALVSDNLDKNLSSKSKANEINTKPISIVSPYASNNLTEVNAKSQQQLIQSINNNSKIVSESINKVETQIENKNNQPLVLTPQQQQQNSLFLLQTQNSIVSHPGAPPSAPPSLPNSSFSSLSSSSSSTSSSSSSNTLLPDTSMILNDFLKQNPNNNLNMNNVNNANCSFENNAASMETLRKLTQLIPSLGVQNQSDAVAVLNKLTHLINDENEYNKVKNNGLNLNIILNESANQHINQLNTPSSSSSSSLNNKPIGYERHEKQIQHANNNNNIINNIPVNQNRNSLIQDINFPFFPNNFVNNSNFLEQQQNMKNFLSPSNLPLINQTQNLETLNNLDLLAFETQKAKLLSQFDANNMAALNVPFNNLNINETFQINNNNNNNINNIISNEIAFQQMPLFNQWINSDFNSNNRVNFPPINNLLLANNQINLATAKMGISSSNQNSNILPPGVFSYSDIGLNNQFQNDEHIHFQNLDTHKNNVNIFFRYKFS
jgi:ankyrin repeat protein